MDKVEALGILIANYNAEKRPDEAENPCPLCEARLIGINALEREVKREQGNNWLKRLIKKNGGSSVIGRN
jgi:hypothetical protein